MANITNNSGSMSLIGDPIDEPARVVFIITSSAMILGAVIGNFTLIAVAVSHFRRSRQRPQQNRQKPLQNVFLVNLALVDILTSGYWYTFFVLDLALGYHPVANASHCIANGMIISTLSAVNLLSFLSIHFYCYLRICHSRLYPRVFTLKKTLIYCLFIWVIGTLLTLPLILDVGAGSYHYRTLSHVCAYNRDDDATYPKTGRIMLGSLFLGGIIFFNASIFRFWRKHQKSSSFCYPLAKKPHKSRKLKTLTIDTDETVETTACSSDVIIEEKDQDSSVATPAAASSTSAVASTSTNAAPTSMTRSLMSSTTPTSTIESPSTPPVEASMTATSTSMAHEPLSRPSKYGEEQPQTTTTSYSQQKRLRKTHAKQVRFVLSLFVVCILMFTVLLVFIIGDASNTNVSPESSMGWNSLIFFINAIKWAVYGTMNHDFRKIYAKCIQRAFAACRRSNRKRADAVPQHIQ